MCFIHEEEYDGQCWDEMFFTQPQKFTDSGIEDFSGKPIIVLDPDTDHSLVDLLRDGYDIKILQPDEFKEMMFQLFQRMHETGVIAPYNPLKLVNPIG